MRAVESLVDAFAGTAAVYAQRLDTDEVLAIGEVDRSFPTGSAAKMLLLAVFAERVAVGELDPACRVEITQEFRDLRPGSGVLRFLAAGLQPTLRDCATLMMIVSDNVATDVVLDALGGPETVNAALAQLGCGQVAITSPTVWALPPAQFGMASPKGLAGLWSRLAESGPATDICREITWRHQHKEGFARLVPFSPDLADFGMKSPLRLWSKSGSYPTVNCEAGLFETDITRVAVRRCAAIAGDTARGPRRVRAVHRS